MSKMLSDAGHIGIHGGVDPICWLLTVDSEMALFPFHSLAEGVLVFS